MTESFLKKISKLVVILALFLTSARYTFAQESTKYGIVYTVGDRAYSIAYQDKNHPNRFMIYEGDSAAIKRGEADFCANFEYKDYDRVENYFISGKVHITGDKYDDLHFLQYYCGLGKEKSVIVKYWDAPNDFAGGGSKGFSVQLPDNFEEVFDNVLSDAELRDEFIEFQDKSPAWHNEK